MRGLRGLPVGRGAPGLGGYPQRARRLVWEVIRRGRGRVVWGCYPAERAGAWSGGVTPQSARARGLRGLPEERASESTAVCRCAWLTGNPQGKRRVVWGCYPAERAWGIPTRRQTQVADALRGGPKSSSDGSGMTNNPGGKCESMTTDEGATPPVPAVPTGGFWAQMP